MKYEVHLKEEHAFYLEINTGIKDPDDAEADEETAISLAWKKLTETKASRDEHFDDYKGSATAFVIEED